MEAKILDYATSELSRKGFTKIKIVKLANDNFNVILDKQKSKKALIEEYLEIQAEQLALREKQSEAEIDKEVDLAEFNTYMVRYVGYASLLEQGANSTPSHSTYVFNKGAWVEVLEIDFKRKYYKKMKGAVDLGNNPHFECARAKKDDNGKIIDMYYLHRDYLESLTDKRIRTLSDLSGINEFQLVRLNAGGIRSLHDFVAIPDEWYRSNLRGVDNIRLQEWRDEAFLGIDDDRKENEIAIQEAKQD